MQSNGKVIDFNRISQTNLDTTTRKKPKILFVDDEERILNTMQALFRRQYDTTTTTDGYHALELLKQDHYQLLVSDQRMPIMAGVDLLREAKDVSPNTMRILLTGYSDLAAVIGSVNEGEVFRFINKPWNTQEFVATVDEAVKIGLELEKAANDASGALKPVADQAPLPTESANTAGENVIVLNGDAEILTSVRSMLPECHILEANDYNEAIDLMLRHEIGVIISNLDDDHEGALEFFSLLKNEHPQIVSVLLANNGDSTTLVQLINHARIFRYMFKPIRTKLMTRFLNASIEQYRKFKTSPTLLKQQRAQVKPLEPVDEVVEDAVEVKTITDDSDKNTVTPMAKDTQSTSNLLGKMRKIRSFFSRLVSK
jgi:serine/threonine-protein kinase